MTEKIIEIACKCTCICIELLRMDRGGQNLAVLPGTFSYLMWPVVRPWWSEHVIWMAFIAVSSPLPIWYSSWNNGDATFISLPNKFFYMIESIRTLIEGIYYFSITIAITFLSVAIYFQMFQNTFKLLCLEFITLTPSLAWTLCPWLQT